VGLDQWP